jgi:hypothetical protein
MKDYIEIAESIPWLLSFILSPPCREVENMIPLEALLFVAAGNAEKRAAQILDKINQAEQLVGTSESRLFYLHFDMKSGYSPEYLARIADSHTRNWVISGLKKGDLDPHSDYLSGFGQNLIKRVGESSSALEVLHGQIRSSRWKSVFFDFLDDLSWICAGPAPSIT